MITNRLNSVNVKAFIRYIPEILLLTGGIACLVGEWVGTSSINGIIILGMLPIAILLVWRNKYLALVIAMILGSVSAYFILSTLSEFTEFPSDNTDRWQLLSGGLLIFGSLLAVSWVLPRKYFKAPR